MTSEKYNGPWCAECGYPATERAASIDPRYPLGRCNRSKVGCKGGNPVALVRTRDQADQAYDRRRRRLTTARHNQHDPVKAPQAYCDRCPTPRRTSAEHPHGIPVDAVQAPADATGRRP